MIETWIIVVIVLALLVLLLFIILASLYTIVPADYADVVIQGSSSSDDVDSQRGMRVYSSHREYSKDGKGAYFKIPSWFFIFRLGMKVHRIPLQIIDINVPDFLAFDKDRARFVCNIVAFVTVTKPMVAAKRFSGDMEKLQLDVAKVVQATTRDATTKKPIREIINDRDSIINTIRDPLTKALTHWGLELRDIELVEFRDPTPTGDEDDTTSHVIADISSIIEEQINSEARQKNAEQKKTAKVKEAEADEVSKKREIQRDEEVGVRKQQQEKQIFVQEKLAREAQLEVEKVQQVKTQEIEKERQIVEANQKKEVEIINKEQKKLLGEGDHLQKEEQAKGDAAATREEGLAEAAAKEALQVALNKFEDKAIRALVAEKIVEMQKIVGVAGAKALENADLRMFVGSDEGGFDMGKMIASTMVANDSSAGSVLNRLARPNDLGFSSMDQLLGAIKDANKDKNPPPKKEFAQLPGVDLTKEPIKNPKLMKKLKDASVEA